MEYYFNKIAEKISATLLLLPHGYILMIYYKFLEQVYCRIQQLFLDLVKYMEA